MLNGCIKARLDCCMKLIVRDAYIHHREEYFMQAVFEVGLAAGFNPEMHKNALVRDFEESLQWWIHRKPEVTKRLPSFGQHCGPSSDRCSALLCCPDTQLQSRGAECTKAKA